MEELLTRVVPPKRGDSRTRESHVHGLGIV